MQKDINKIDSTRIIKKKTEIKINNIYVEDTENN